MDKIIIGRRYTIDQIFEDNRELLDEFLGFFGEGEGAVVYGGEV
jgi:hypothetical protein